jgi:hypothetical protein
MYAVFDICVVPIICPIRVSISFRMLPLIKKKPNNDKVVLDMIAVTKPIQAEL